MHELQIQALLLCRTLIHDSMTYSFSAINIFDQITAPSYDPPIELDFTVMTVYRGGREGDALGLKILGPDPSSKPMGIYGAKILKPDPITVSFFHINMARFVVPQPGPYSFELCLMAPGKPEVSLMTTRLLAVEKPINDLNLSP